MEPHSELVPLLVAASEGITCVGPKVFDLAFARALWSQLAWNGSPELVASWSTGPERAEVSLATSWPVRLVDHLDDVSSTCRYVVEILSPNQARLSDRDDCSGGSVSFIPDYVSEPEVRTLSARLAEVTRHIEQEFPGADLPASLTLSDILPQPGEITRSPRHEGGRSTPVGRGSLVTPVGKSGEGIVTLDLVKNGPHAVVAGMTGTGKTEFLVSWILSLAWTYTPPEVTFLIIDFKGGAGFARVAELPHCLGIVTDLDVEAAQRALQSLRAEMRYRERLFNTAAVTDIATLPENFPLARLVIVVDEYRALLALFPELQHLFDDIAARGRALGIHLILGTQRTTGVVAEGILANCPLRIVFRVNNVADSLALIEADAARTLPEIPGRAVVRGVAAGLLHVHMAHTLDAEGMQALRNALVWQREHQRWEPRRPWLPPLPSLVERSSLTGNGAVDGAPDPRFLILGLLDEPEEQRQSTCSYDPLQDGHLLIRGRQGGGKSTALRLLAEQSRQALYVGAHNVEATWDVVADAPNNSLVLIDDLDAVLAQFSLEHRDAFVDALLSLLRTGPRRGVCVVIACHSGAALTSSWGVLMKSTLFLDGLPGRGQWGGHVLQLAVPESRRSAASLDDEVETDAPAMQWVNSRDYIVVSSRPRVLVAGLRLRESTLQIVDLGHLRSGGDAAGDLLAVTQSNGARVYVGDVEDWQAQWNLLARLRTQATFIFDECSPAEVRAVRRSRDVMPHAKAGTALALGPEGRAARVQLI
jgi:S-DNA-T family DNA segregation ATPase FtsK/SpoIIIE